MDKTVAGVVTAVAALALAPAHSPDAHTVQSVAPTSYAAAMQAHSYADLLRPIPNARNVLASAPVSRVADVSDEQPASHHHHHHHDHVRVEPPPPPPPPPHHHHHHHHNQQI